MKEELASADRYRTENIGEQTLVTSYPHVEIRTLDRRPQISPGDLVEIFIPDGDVSDTDELTGERVFIHSAEVKVWSDKIYVTGFVRNTGDGLEHARDSEYWSFHLEEWFIKR